MHSRICELLPAADRAWARHFYYADDSTTLVSGTSHPETAARGRRVACATRVAYRENFLQLSVDKCRNFFLQEPP